MDGLPLHAASITWIRYGGFQRLLYKIQIFCNLKYEHWRRIAGACFIIFLHIPLILSKTTHEWYEKIMKQESVGTHEFSERQNELIQFWTHQFKVFCQHSVPVLYLNKIIEIINWGNTGMHPVQNDSNNISLYLVLFFSQRRSVGLLSCQTFAPSDYPYAPVFT